jgi:hypothetical protein
MGIKNQRSKLPLTWACLARLIHIYMQENAMTMPMGGWRSSTNLFCTLACNCCIVRLLGSGSVPLLNLPANLVHSTWNAREKEFSLWTAPPWTLKLNFFPFRTLYSKVCIVAYTGSCHSKNEININFDKQSDFIPSFLSSLKIRFYYINKFCHRQLGDVRLVMHYNDISEIISSNFITSSQAASEFQLLFLQFQLKSSRG